MSQAGRSSEHHVGAPDTAPWSVPVRRADVPETGRHLDLAPDAAVRAAIARLAGVVAVPQLTASFDVTLRGRGGLRVQGLVSATVTQTCVVTVEPIDNAIEEPVDLVFMPESARGDPIGGAASEIEVPAEDEPELLIDDMVDLGVIATEFLVLGVDPYPRKAGAVFDAPAAPDDPARPFAALAALKGSPAKKKNEREG
jgi:Large ribosomal RNA subunit accumulation protein YceD